MDEVEYDWEDDKIDKYKEHMLKSFKYNLQSDEYDVVVLDAVNALVDDFKAHYYFAMRLKKWTVSDPTLETYRNL